LRKLIYISEAFPLYG